VVAVILCVVAVVLHTLPVAALDVSTTLPPGQKVSGPDAEIEGVDGIGLTVMVTAADGGLVHAPAVCVTVIVPELYTVILCVVAPVLHVLPVVALDVSTTLSPRQKVSGPPVMVGADGALFAPTTALSILMQPLASVMVTRYVPAPRPVAESVVLVAFQTYVYGPAPPVTAAWAHPLRTPQSVF
jgi:hypothetical protein